MPSGHCAGGSRSEALCCSSKSVILTVTRYVAISKIASVNQIGTSMNIVHFTMRMLLRDGMVYCSRELSRTRTKTLLPSQRSSKRADVLARLICIRACAIHRDELGILSLVEDHLQGMLKTSASLLRNTASDHSRETRRQSAPSHT